MRGRPPRRARARRGSSSASRSTGAAAHIDRLLRDIQKALFDRAKKYRDARTVTANTLDEFQATVPGEGADDEDERPTSAR